MSDYSLYQQKIFLLNQINKSTITNNDNLHLNKYSSYKNFFIDLLEDKINGRLINLEKNQGKIENIYLEMNKVIKEMENLIVIYNKKAESSIKNSNQLSNLKNLSLKKISYNNNKEGKDRQTDSKFSLTQRRSYSKSKNFNQTSQISTSQLNTSKYGFGIKLNKSQIREGREEKELKEKSKIKVRKATTEKNLNSTSVIEKTVKSMKDLRNISTSKKRESSERKIKESKENSNFGNESTSQIKSKRKENINESLNKLIDNSTPKNISSSNNYNSYIKPKIESSIINNTNNNTDNKPINSLNNKINQNLITNINKKMNFNLISLNLNEKEGENQDDDEKLNLSGILQINPNADDLNKDELLNTDFILNSKRESLNMNLSKQNTLSVFNSTINTYIQLNTKQNKSNLKLERANSSRPILFSLFNKTISKIMKFLSTSLLNNLMRINKKTRKQVFLYYIKEKTYQIGFINKLLEKVKLIRNDKVNPVRSNNEYDDDSIFIYYSNTNIYEYLSDKSRENIKLMEEEDMNKSVLLLINMNEEEFLKKDVMLIYYILMTFFDIKSRIGYNYYDLISYMKNIFIQQNRSISYILYKIIDNCNHSNSTFPIDISKRILFKIIGREHKVSSSHLKNSCLMSSLIGGIIKEILVYYGIIYDKKINNLEKYKYLLNCICKVYEEEKSRLEKMNGKEEK